MRPGCCLARLLLRRAATLQPSLQLQLHCGRVDPWRQRLQQLHPLLQQRCQAGPVVRLLQVRLLLPGLLLLQLAVGLLLLLATGCRGLLQGLARCCCLGQQLAVQRPAGVGRLQGGSAPISS